MNRQTIALQDVAVAYRTVEGIKPVLTGISLTIRPGDFVALVGGNGSGKSTLARVIAGLCPISRGKLWRDPPSERSVQIILQNPAAQLVGDTVYEDICFGLENLCVPREEMPERVRAALALVGLEGFESRFVDRLSGGEKQLVCIAGVLAMGAQTIIFDEATTMLDCASRKHILAVAVRLHKQGTTIVWVTQFMDEAACATQVAALAAGRLAFAGKVEDFFYSREYSVAAPCTALGFTPPYPVRIALELLRAGVKLDELPLRNDDLLEAVAALCR